MFTLRKRILQYPALVNCTSIDWFCEWPRDALLEVAERYLDGLELGSVEGVRNADTHKTSCDTAFKNVFDFHTKTFNYHDSVNLTKHLNHKS